MYTLISAAQVSKRVFFPQGDRSSSPLNQSSVIVTLSSVLYHMKLTAKSEKLTTEISYINQVWAWSNFSLVSLETFPLETPIRCHPGWFYPQCQHTTAPPSFATSAWSHPLQHKHNIQEISPAARIISPCNTTQLLSSGSPFTLPHSIPP